MITDYPTSTSLRPQNQYYRTLALPFVARFYVLELREVSDGPFVMSPRSRA